MPSTVVFDAATLSDAVQKAARVAPRKGPAFDKAGGLLFSIRPGEGTCTVSATDLDTSYTQYITFLEVKGDRPEVIQWRTPSNLMSDILSTISMGEGATVSLIDRGDNWLRLLSGKLKGRIATLDPLSFPTIEWFTQDGLSQSHEFSQRLAQVSWAVGESNSKLGGVRVDGEWLMATNRYCCAIAPCIAYVERPITVPLINLETVLSKSSDLRMKYEEGSGNSRKRLMMMMDDETQATSTIIDEDFPDLMSVCKVATRVYDGSLTAGKGAVKDALDRMQAIARTDRMPALRLEVNGMALLRELVFDMDVTGTGRVQDSIDVDSDYDEVFSWFINPGYFRQAVDACRGDRCIIDFGPENQPVRVRDETGYQCYLMPIQK